MVIMKQVVKFYNKRLRNGRLMLDVNRKPLHSSAVAKGGYAHDTPRGDAKIKGITINIIYFSFY